MNNVLIIGCGHMGSALLSLWSKNKLYKFTIVDPLKYKTIRSKFINKRVQSITSAKEIKNSEYFDIVVLAVKPQVIERVLKEYKFFPFKKTFTPPKVAFPSILNSFLVIKNFILLSEFKSKP